MNLTEAPEFEGLVTFEQNRKERIHNWWWYKEGFSHALVDRLLDRLKVGKDGLVLDPFCGSGTTMLSCRQRGVASVGFELNPLLVLVSRVKTREYDLEELAKFVKQARGWKFEKPVLPKDAYFRKAFSKYALQDIFWLKGMISSVREESAREFLYLALIDAAMKGSWTVKQGSVVKTRKMQVPPVGRLFKNNLRHWLKDLQKANIPVVSSSAYAGDARRLPLGSGSVDCIITSPPYLNKPEWQSEFRVELNLFFGLPPTWRPQSIAIEPGQLKKLEAAIGCFGSLPDDARDYFGSMIDSLGEMHRVLKKGGRAAVIIGGGCFPDRVVENDTCFVNLAETVGFSVKEVLVARRLCCTRDRTIKIGQVRESVLVLEK